MSEQMTKTPGHVLFDECVARNVQVTCADVGVFHELAAAVIAHHEASQLMTWDEAMEWAIRGNDQPSPVMAWRVSFEGDPGAWIVVRPEMSSGGPLRDTFRGSGVSYLRHEPALTHFRKLPPAPEGGQR